MVCKLCGRTVRGRPSADGTCRQCRGLPPSVARKPKTQYSSPAPSAITEADESSDGAEDDAPEDAE